DFQHRVPADEVVESRVEALDGAERFGGALLVAARAGGRGGGESEQGDGGEDDETVHGGRSPPEVKWMVGAPTAYPGGPQSQEAAPFFLGRPRFQSRRMWQSLHPTCAACQGSEEAPFAYFPNKSREETFSEIVTFSVLNPVCGGSRAGYEARRRLPWTP